MYQHMTTTTTATTTITTAIVETPLDSRALPVATEHAVPSTLPHHPLAVGKNKLLAATILLLLLNMYAQSSDFHQCMYVP